MPEFLLRDTDETHRLHDLIGELDAHTRDYLSTSVYFLPGYTQDDIDNAADMLGQYDSGGIVELASIIAAAAEGDFATAVKLVFQHCENERLRKKYPKVWGDLQDPTTKQF